jgi:DNA-binding SARP family transcriptional activator
MEDPGQDTTARPDELRLSLLGGFAVVVRGRKVNVPPSAQRVLVALAVRGQEQDRAVLGATLYPDARPSQVSANLRSALWRGRYVTCHPLVVKQGERLRLDDSLLVDLQEWRREARLLTTGHWGEPPAAHYYDFIEALSQELLPSWNEEWLVLERQRWDHVRLHSLEWLAGHLVAVGRHMDALEAGLAAVAIEPYRESAHRALINAYMAEGNSASALAQYQRCQQLLMRDLGVRPTAQLRALIERLTGS